MERLVLFLVLVFGVTLLGCGSTLSQYVDDVLVSKTSVSIMSAKSERASENVRGQAEIGKMTGNRQVELVEESITVRKRRGTHGGPMMSGNGPIGPRNCKPLYYGQPMDPGKADRCREAEVMRDRRSTYGGTPYGVYGQYGTYGAGAGYRGLAPGQSTFTAPGGF